MTKNNNVNQSLSKFFCHAFISLRAIRGAGKFIITCGDELAHPRINNFLLFWSGVRHRLPA
jgi:hypothetical protein